MLHRTAAALPGWLRGSYLSYVLLFAFYFGSTAFFSSLVSVYLMDKGYTATQVSFVVSCSLVASVALQPVVGMLGERFPQRKVTLGVLLVAAGFGVLFLFAGGLASIALSYSMALGLVNSANPVVERSATLAKFSYRSTRIWGTLGYALCSQLGGVIYRYVSPQWMYAGFVISVLLCALGYLGTQDRAPAPVPDADRQAAGPAEEATQGRLWTRPFVLYLVITCLVWGIANVSRTYLPSMFQAEGVPVDRVSTILFALTLTELPLIFLSRRFMDRLSNGQLIGVVFVLLVVQHAVYALVPVVAVQVVTAILCMAVSTMLFIMINLKAVASLLPESRQAAGLALANTSRNFGSILFQMAGGALLEHTSYSAFYLILMAASCAGLVLCALSRLPDGRKVKMFA